MEEPDWTVTDVHTVEAADLQAAKAKWIKLADLPDKKRCWDPASQTYWSWRVVEVTAPRCRYRYKDMIRARLYECQLPQGHGGDHEEDGFEWDPSLAMEPRVEPHPTPIPESE